MDITVNSVVAYANFYQFNTGAVIQYPRVDSRLFLWCKGGRGLIKANGHPFQIKADEYLVIPWQHTIAYEADVSSPFLMAGVHIIPYHDLKHPVVFDVAHHSAHPLANCSWRHDIAFHGLENVRYGSLATQRALKLLAEYVVERFAASRLPDELEMRVLARVMLSEIARTFSESPDAEADTPAALNSAMHWVRQNLEKPADLSQLADAVGCSVSSVRRMFRRYLKASPAQWIARVKMVRAEELLRTTSLPVSEVAKRVGFADPFYFSRWYHRHSSESPRQARMRRRPL